MDLVAITLGTGWTCTALLCMALVMVCSTPDGVNENRTRNWGRMRLAPSVLNA